MASATCPILGCSPEIIYTKAESNKRAVRAHLDVPRDAQRIPPPGLIEKVVVGFTAQIGEIEAQASRARCGARRGAGGGAGYARECTGDVAQDRRGMLPPGVLPAKRRGHEGRRRPRRGQCAQRVHRDGKLRVVIEFALTPERAGDDGAMLKGYWGRVWPECRGRRTICPGCGGFSGRYTMRNGDEAAMEKLQELDDMHNEWLRVRGAA
ncbi:hypothetical protein B0H17DRAFT_1173873 [Mycena rosella]|uniref:Uncharacterized protein n=1 Tax=Mycena rosella TaxID=1033263 RepID=A0AAD7H1V1_MYCRO|nr:hypothetical protein B0H17DRAFT_1173873 [Mycena rosella]